MGAGVTCAACGARVSKRWRRCLRCGAPVELAPATAKTQGRRRPILAAGALACAVLAAVGVRVVGDGGALLGRRGQAASATSAPAAPVAATPETPAPAPTAIAPEGGVDFHAAGYTAFESGDYLRALSLYQDAAAHRPQDAEARNNVGQTLVKLERAGEAIPWFEQAIRLEPDLPMLHFNLAGACERAGDLDRAEREFRTTAALAPQDFAARYNLGLVLFKRNDDVGAIEQFTAAIALQPDEGRIYFALGISLDRQGRRAESAAAYRKYLEREPAAANAEQVRQRISRLTAPVDATSSPSANP